MSVKVLIADDDEGIRSTVSEMLRGAGYEVSEAENGQAALEWLAREGFAVLLLDMRMPGKDGIAVLNEIEPAPPPPHVVIVSAYELDRDVSTSLASKIFTILRKPVLPRALLDTISDAVSTAGGERGA